MFHEFDILLSDYYFFRSHNYHIINVNEISKFNNIESATINMSDGSSVPLSIKRKDAFKRIIHGSTAVKGI